MGDVTSFPAARLIEEWDGVDRLYLVPLDPIWELDKEKHVMYVLVSGIHCRSGRYRACWIQYPIEGLLSLRPRCGVTSRSGAVQSDEVAPLVDEEGRPVTGSHIAVCVFRKEDVQNLSYDDLRTLILRETQMDAELSSLAGK